MRESRCELGGGWIGDEGGKGVSVGMDGHLSGVDVHLGLSDGRRGRRRQPQAVQRLLPQSRARGQRLEGLKAQGREDLRGTAPLAHGRLVVGRDARQDVEVHVLLEHRVREERLVRRQDEPRLLRQGLALRRVGIAGGDDAHDGIASIES